jgi:hypothetical protein
VSAEDTKPQGLTGTAKLAVVLLVALVVVGLIWRGFTMENWRRLLTGLADRPDGPFSLRFLLQPVTAAIAALKDGVKDARAGRSPYLWNILRNPEERAARLSEALVSTAQIILIGLGIDAFYQLKVFKTFYPGEALAMVIALAFLPYLLLRGPIARIASLFVARKSGTSP